MSEPLHVAFVWHMHQPYYRLRRDAPFDMPWARMHALKDYLDMVEILADYPTIHQTFNLVPSLVEQLEDYASGDFADVYWEHTLRPADQLTPEQQAFIVERMCERSDHPRARSYPRYLELANKRDAHTCDGWDNCASFFTVDELRDLQVWFNLAWFDPHVLAASPLSDLVARGRNFTENDKLAIAKVQRELLNSTLPAYRAAAARGQIELSTTPYYHPILPLLANTDSARVACADLLLPQGRFTHPEDAAEQVARAVAKHEATFGAKPSGMWCSEQAVGEDVIPLLLSNGFSWTISDETVLARSLAGVCRPQIPGAPRETLATTGGLTPTELYRPYRLSRREGELSIVFRDHTLSDLIGFAYSSWNSRDAANDLLRRLREIHASLVVEASASATDGNHNGPEPPLVTIALDGENAWEYYPHDGRDFLQYLYEGLAADPDLRCVTVSEHLAEAPATHRLDWLHTGSWIGGDLRTWIGDQAHGTAWELLRETRDMLHTAAAERGEAYEQLLIAEGSDWFWWFGDHHHTPLDSVWDANFRGHLQEAYRLASRDAPLSLFMPILQTLPGIIATPATSQITPAIDGIIGKSTTTGLTEWEGAGLLAPTMASTMERAEAEALREVRGGRDSQFLYLLIVPESPESLPGMEIQVQIVDPSTEQDLVLLAFLKEDGTVRAECKLSPRVAAFTRGAWQEVVELALPLSEMPELTSDSGLAVRIGRDGMVEHLYHSAPLGTQ